MGSGRYRTMMSPVYNCAFCGERISSWNASTVFDDGPGIFPSFTPVCSRSCADELRERRERWHSWERETGQAATDAAFAVGVARNEVWLRVWRYHLVLTFRLGLEYHTAARIFGRMLGPFGIEVWRRP